jgi:hypothetical protein
LEEVLSASPPRGSSSSGVDGSREGGPIDPQSARGLSELEIPRPKDDSAISVDAGSSGTLDKDKLSNDWTSG